MKFEEKKGFYTPEDVGNIPELPGVYLMKNKKGEVIYVGKALNLKKRVSSYFYNKSRDTKLKFLLDNLSSIDIITVRNETEALLLEATLIKEYKPRYNVYFKDNKFYPYIKITINEDFPRIVFSRDQKFDDSLYFGPYVSAKAVREYIDLVQRIFLLRSCKTLPKKECLNYHIRRCSAPCIGKISKEDYRKNVNETIDFLKGEYKKVLISLENEMKEYAKKLEFEKAQAIKEKIDTIRIFEENQSVIFDENINRDYIGFFSKWGKAVIVVSKVRNGRIVGKKSFSSSLHIEESMEDLISLFLLYYLQEETNRPSEIVVEDSMKGILSRFDEAFINMGVTILTPENEREASIINMCKENASLHFVQIWSKMDTSETLRLLQDLLGLRRLPVRIEGFDVANIMGEYPVASIVSFYGGKPDKSNYRHMKIRSKSTPDDYTMIYEAVYRRYSRLKRESRELPDLILIDGGKGQLNAALKALRELELDLDVIGLAKKEEKIYLPDQNYPISLPENSPALHLLQQVRDETHRFANSFFRKIKQKGDLSSIFDDIEGVGEKRKSIIMKKFLDYDIIKNLKEEDLIKEGLPEGVARKVYERLKGILSST